jgi:ubiquinone/menaquinone biosynthesis C-methylase UbiE
MTQPVNYDLVASTYDRRYERHQYEGVKAVLHRFIDAPGLDVAEVACGTGHWVAGLRDRVGMAAALDFSFAMLERARTAAPFAHIVRGRAEQLPWTTTSFDRVFCINALHHFEDPDAFIAEARRVLRPAGAVLIAGLDPHTQLDSWWVYDYFPSAFEIDRARFRSAQMIRERLQATGFVDPRTELAHRFQAAIAFEDAIPRGLLDRRSTSQLMLVSDAEYEAGMERLRQEQPILRSDVRLYATVASAAPR